MKLTRHGTPTPENPLMQNYYASIEHGRFSGLYLKIVEEFILKYVNFIY